MNYYVLVYATDVSEPVAIEGPFITWRAAKDFDNIFQARVEKWTENYPRFQDILSTQILDAPQLQTDPDETLQRALEGAGWA